MANQASKLKLSKTLSIVLGLILIGSIAGIVYMITVPESEDAFTEFYILGPGGAAADYHTQIKVGEEAEIILGIINNERKAMSYSVAIRADGVDIGGLEPILLEPLEKLERIVFFTMNKPGERQKVDFLLYKEGQIEAYESLHLWVDVRE